MKNKVVSTVSFILFAAVLLTFCIHGLSTAAETSITGESLEQDKRDKEYMSMLTQQKEVSFLEFKPGPFVKAKELFYDYMIAGSFVRLHDPSSSTPLTLEEVKKDLYYVHDSAVELEDQIERMKIMREELSKPEKQSIDPVIFNDESRVWDAGKQEKVEVPKVIYHAHLNGSPYAVVVRFDAYSGNNENMKLYQGYMTLLWDQYSWEYYHCSGLKEIE